MGYSIGQFRRPQIESYLIPLSMTMQQQPTTSVEDELSIFFLDSCGNLTGNNILNNQNCYYLRFGIYQRNDSDQIFDLKIRNRELIEDNEQWIEQFKVPKGNSIVYFETIIAPNATYDQILWELQRTSLDYRMENSNGTYGRTTNIIVDNYSGLVDIIQVLKTRDPNLKYLTKIGIQGPPSLLMCINREQIRLGKRGIYEINNGINITSISFVPKVSTLASGELDYFIMDFEY